jgi:lipopolysaccharide/colanic/teichoic acid biosynthesis glycosyltransferase
VFSLEHPDHPGERRHARYAKQFMDVAIALVLFVLLAPIMLLLALAIKLDSRGPVFYRSRRVGLAGHEFEMLKFRKMQRDADGPRLTSASDERFTRIGSVLARTKLDELPQLVNVIRGDMSLVGPRPEDPSFVALYPEEFAEILQVKPGITGLSQLAFADEGRLLAGHDRITRYVEALLPQKIAIDRLYIAHRSIRMDVRILLWTVRAVLFRVQIAVDRRTADLSVRRRSTSNRAAA